MAPDLGVLLDRVADLPVEEEPVGDHDDGIEDRGAVLREPDQLMRQPSDGVALAAARGVLDQVAPAGAVRGGVGEQPAHHVELVVARPDLGSRLPGRFSRPWIPPPERSSPGCASGARGSAPRATDSRS